LRELIQQLRLATGVFPIARFNSLRWNYRFASPPGDGVSDEDNVFHHFRFDQLGVRVPAVVISPLIARNIVDGTTYDHSSLLATVEAIFGLPPLTARDAAASNLLKLVTRSTPRTDAPTDIGRAAESGFTCDDDPNSEASRDASMTPPALSESTDGENGRRGYDWTRSYEPPGAALRGFQEIALLKALKNARGRDRTQIRKEYFAAVTKGGAKHFIHKVAQMTGKTRVSYRPERKPAILSPFGLPPTRQWTADSISAYRRRTGD
jgi:phospholipase C